MVTCGNTLLNLNGPRHADESLWCTKNMDAKLVSCCYFHKRTPIVVTCRNDIKKRGPSKWNDIISGRGTECIGYLNGRYAGRMLKSILQAELHVVVDSIPFPISSINFSGATLHHILELHTTWNSLFVYNCGLVRLIDTMNFSFKVESHCKGTTMTKKEYKPELFWSHAGHQSFAP